MSRTSGATPTAPPWSPAAALAAQIAAALAAGTIPCACPHPAEAAALSIPSRTLRCFACDAAADQAGDQPDAASGPCASCGTDNAAEWIGWAAGDGRISVTARVCPPCATGRPVSVT